MQSLIIRSCLVLTGVRKNAMCHVKKGVGICLKLETIIRITNVMSERFTYLFQYFLVYATNPDHYLEKLIIFAI